MSCEVTQGGDGVFYDLDTSGSYAFFGTPEEWRGNAPGFIRELRNMAQRNCRVEVFKHGILATGWLKRLLLHGNLEQVDTVVEVSVLNIVRLRDNTCSCTFAHGFPVDAASLSAVFRSRLNHRGLEVRDSDSLLSGIEQGMRGVPGIMVMQTQGKTNDHYSLTSFNEIFLMGGKAHICDQATPVDSVIQAATAYMADRPTRIPALFNQAPDTLLAVSAALADEMTRMGHSQRFCDVAGVAQLTPASLLSYISDIPDRPA